jgi:enterochelin esterase-like enzyme
MFTLHVSSSAALGAALLGWIALATACRNKPGSPAASAPTLAAAADPTAPVPAAAAPSAPQLLRVTRSSAATHAERDHYLYLPAGHASDVNKRWPVLLFLHGNGERGDARSELDYLFENGPLYEAWIQKRDLPFIIIVPQLPMYGQDAKADYLKHRRREEIPARLAVGVPERPAEFPTPQPMTGAQAEELPSEATAYGPPMGWPELEADLLGMLDDVLQNQRGDATRQYLTGVSYGGFGTWYLASRHPERFAAILPVVGYAHPDLIPPIARAKIPIWCFAGGRDGAVLAKYFYPGMNRLEALGHEDFRFTIEADMGHDVWARVYAGQDIYTWLLSHKKDPPPPNP